MCACLDAVDEDHEAAGAQHARHLRGHRAPHARRQLVKQVHAGHLRTVSASTTRVYIYPIYTLASSTDADGDQTSGYAFERLTRS